MTTTSSKISQFIGRTGSSHKVAQELLKDNHWNVEHAVSIYKLMNEVSTMPKKNSNVKQNQSDPLQTNGTGVVASSSGARHLPHDFRASNKIKPALLDDYNSLVSKGRQHKSLEIHTRSACDAPHDSKSPLFTHFDDSPDSTFILPDFSLFQEDFRSFLDKDLIETSTLELLMKAGRLNWWSDLGCQPLFPLVTTGDGNCLLHAASLALWGHQDQELVLRKRLYDMMLNSSCREAFFRRWKWHQSQINKQSELVYNDQEWSEEWNSLVKLASPQPRVSSCGVDGTNSTSTVVANQGQSNGCRDHSHIYLHGNHQQQQNTSSQQQQYDQQQEIQYESLEELHIFVLAHLLRRPIIITADTILRDSNGEALAPITFGGVYLPLECPPSSCHRFPILLTYDAAHFSALVPMEDSFQVMPYVLAAKNVGDAHAFTGSIPLVDCNLDLLPVHFVYDPGPNYRWNQEEDEPEDKKKGDELKLKDGQVRHHDGHLVVTDDAAVIPLSEKVAALKKYLDIEVIPLVSGMANSFSSLDSTKSSHSVDSVEMTTLLKNGCHSEPAPQILLAMEDSSSKRRSLESAAKQISVGSSITCDSVNGVSPHSSGSKNNLNHLISNDLYNEEKSKTDCHTPAQSKSKGLGKLKRLAKSVSSNFKKSLSVKKLHSEKNIDGVSAGTGTNSKSKLHAVNNCSKGAKKLESVIDTAEANNIVAFIVESLQKKTRVPCVQLLYKRQEYQNDIIRTYLEQASERFVLSRKRDLDRLQALPPPPPSLFHHCPLDKQINNYNFNHQQQLPHQQQQLPHQQQQLPHLQQQQVLNNIQIKSSPVQCVNAGCDGTATSETCYLCEECYEKQRSEEAKINNNNVNDNNIVCNSNVDISKKIVKTKELTTVCIKDFNRSTNSSKISCVQDVCNLGISDGVATNNNSSNSSSSSSNSSCSRSIMIQKSSKNILLLQGSDSSNLIKSSISNEFKLNTNGGVVLEKYTKTDNRMLIATETTQDDFDSGKGDSGKTSNVLLTASNSPTTPDNGPDIQDSGHPIKVNFNHASRQLSVTHKSLPAVEDCEGRVSLLSGEMKRVKNKKCPTESCPFYGSVLTDYYCSSCYKKNML